MMWRTHATGAIASLWLAPPLVRGGSNAEVLAAFAAFGSLLPDLDSRQAAIRSLSARGITPFEPAAGMLHAAFGHRGAMHSLVGAAVIVAIVGTPVTFAAGWHCAVALAVGVGTHLALDACTNSGVPLLWPNRKRVRVLPKPLLLTTGSAAEDLAFVPLALAAVAYLLASIRWAPTP